MPEGKWDCLQQTAVLSGFRQFYKAMLIYNSQDISSCKLHFRHSKRGAAKSELLNSRSSAPRSPRRLLFHGGALGIPETFLLLIHFPWLREFTASIRPYSQIELKSFGNTNKATTSWPCSVLNFCFIGWNTQARKFSLCYALCMHCVPESGSCAGKWRVPRGPTTSFGAGMEWPGLCLPILWKMHLCALVTSGLISSFSHFSPL